MARPCVEEAAKESGIPVEDLTTMADIYSGPTGLPDAPPYNETVILAPHVVVDSDSERKWYNYTWKKYLETR